jgi:hypothetical protein
MHILMIAHAVLSCDPALTRLFTPPHPRLGHYEVCTTPDTIEQIVQDGGPIVPREDSAGSRVHYGPVEMLLPIDAFGAAGPYNKSAVARLYGGGRAKVARGWRQVGNQFESVTLISPYPDASLTRLERGTMVIVIRIDLPALFRTI